MAKTGDEIRASARDRLRKWRLRHPGVEDARRLEVKREVLGHYGKGKCACVNCGEARMVCLSIDHIDGGGNKQRIGSLRTADTFYRWLRREGYPSGYQTLCMNCQFVKRFQRKEHN